MHLDVKILTVLLILWRVNMTRDNLFETVSYSHALQLLKEGNRRYVKGQPKSSATTPEIRAALVAKQSPFAIIIGCSDSRVPPEIIFDQGAGQIFVVRTAGNTADAVTAGSVEYAAEHLHSPLVVVLGHDRCGAVAAAISGGDFGPNIGAIIAQIKPSVEKTNKADEENRLCLSEDENILNTISKLNESPVLKKLIAEGSLKIIGAKYSLASGEVNFWE